MAAITGGVPDTLKRRAGKERSRLSRVLPILFNTEMVRAILDGRKGVTRRIAKGIIPYSEHGDFTTKYKGEWTGPISMENLVKLKAKYQRGDILYVRETWSWEPCWDCGLDTEEHDCCPATRTFNHNKREWGCYVYRAAVDDDVYPSVDTWHPSIHMPKEAARIWLKVTDVRVERLQEMEAGDDRNYIAEGAMDKHDFIRIWNSTIGYTPSKAYELDCYGWYANPWVWVIEFEQCEKPNPCILNGGEPAEDKIPCIGYGISDDDEPCEMCKSCRSWSGYEE